MTMCKARQLISAAKLQDRTGGRRPRVMRPKKWLTFVPDPEGQLEFGQMKQWPEEKTIQESQTETGKQTA